MKRKRNKELASYYRWRPCDACGADDGTSRGDHVRTFGSGGLCSNENMWSLCALCDQIKENQGLNELVAKFPTAQTLLVLKGWEFCDYNNKWIYPIKDN